MIKLNLGCGQECIEGWVAHDLYEPTAGMQFDLNLLPWPVKDKSVTAVRMAHVLEHLVDPVSAIMEAHRILIVGGRLEIIVPHCLGAGASDPDHLHYFSSNWFKCLEENRPYRRTKNSRFKTIALRVETLSTDVLGKLFRHAWLENIIGRGYPAFVEKFSILRPSLVYWVGKTLCQ